MAALPPRSELLAILSGWLAAAFGWIKWLYELREKRLERAAKEKAQSELVEIRRRATDNSPLFLVNNERFNGVTVPGEGKLRARMACLLSSSSLPRLFGQPSREVICATSSLLFGRMG
jgi:hypothetical protein